MVILRDKMEESGLWRCFNILRLKITYSKSFKFIMYEKKNIFSFDVCTYLFLSTYLSEIYYIHISFLSTYLSEIYYIRISFLSTYLSEIHYIHISFLSTYLSKIYWETENLNKSRYGIFRIIIENKFKLNSNV